MVMVSKVMVSNTADLYAALDSAQAGDTIELAAGNYGDVLLEGYVFTDYITLVSADPLNPATFDSLHIKTSSYVRIDSVKVEHILEPDEPDWVSGMRIDKSDHIEIVNSEFTGSQDGDMSNDGQGLLVLDSEHVTIANNDFHDLKVGAGIGRSEYVDVSGNSFHDIRSDGVNFGAVSHVLVEGNSFTDFYPIAGDHPDMIQFFNAGATQDMTDVVIKDNSLSQGDGDAVQGIFIQGVPPSEVGTYPYSSSDFVIEDNVIDLGSAQGIWVSDVDGVEITGNTISEIEGAVSTPMILTTRTTDAVVSDNTAPIIEDVDSIGTIYSNNTITGEEEVGGAINGTSGDDIITGDEGNNGINAGAGADVVIAGGGDDGVFGGGGNDTIYGQTGDDVLFGDGGNDTLNGGAGADVLQGGSGNDGFFGGGGNDMIYGQAGDDVLFGDGGNDTLNGGSGVDVLFGGSGNDGFFGGGGNDLIYGEGGNDALFGDGGEDVLTGGAGDDLLVGGSGADTFVFDTSSGTDVIRDFNVAEDMLQFSSGVFDTAGDALGAASQDGADTVIALDGGDSIRLLDLSVSGLAEGDFLIL